MALKGKFGHHSLKITTNKGNYMIRIITKKRLNEITQKMLDFERNAIVSEKISAEYAKIINNLEKKVNDQREVIVNMMILLDFFSQKLLRKHNKKGGKK